MKETTRKSKKSLWLIIALIAVAVIAGVLLAILLPGNNGGEVPPEEGQKNGVLY